MYACMYACMHACKCVCGGVGRERERERVCTLSCAIIECVFANVSLRSSSVPSSSLSLSVFGRRVLLFLFLLVFMCNFLFFYACSSSSYPLMYVQYSCGVTEMPVSCSSSNAQNSDDSFFGLNLTDIGYKNGYSDFLYRCVSVSFFFACDIVSCSGKHSSPTLFKRTE